MKTDIQSVIKFTNVKFNKFVPKRCMVNRHKVTDGKNEAKAKCKSHKLLIGADFTPEIASDFKLVAGAYTGLAMIYVDLDIAENNKQTKLASIL